jgi:hypothetical protein
MKKAALMVIFFLAGGLNASAKDLYVSPSAEPGGQGTFSAPFASLGEAQATVRKVIAEEAEQDITVYLRDGEYYLHETLILGLQDSPADGFSLYFKAYKDEKPVLTSAVPIGNWQKLEALPEHASAKAQGKLWVAELPQGLANFKTLFDGNRRLTRAKSPSWIPPAPPESIEQSDSRNVHNNKDRYALRQVHYPDDMMREWENISDIEIKFNPVPWNLMTIQLDSVDTTNKIGWLAFEANSQPGTKNPAHAPAFAMIENAIDYLDEPGEWVVNTVENKVYYWPESGRPSENIEAPSLMELVRVEGNIRYDLASDIPAKNIHFDGLTFTKADRSVWHKHHKGWGIQHDWDSFDYGNALLRFRGAENCSVSNSRFTASGGSAVRLDLHAQNITVSNNYIDHVGHMGILLAGYGPGTKYANKNNTVHNNIIHHVGELIWHGHGIFLWQSGDNTISNNWIHDVPRKAIGVAGVRSQILMKPWSDFDEASKTIRWHEIEATVDASLPAQQRFWPYLHARNNLIVNNKATRTMLKLSDGSSINISGAGAGNVVEHNLLYDLLYTGFRTDDWQDGTVIRNNIVWNCNGNAFIFKGYNELYNNIGINVKKAIHLRAYPQQSFIPGALIRNNIFVSQKDGFVLYSPAKWPKTMNLAKPGNKSQPYEHIVKNNVYWFDDGEVWLAEQKAQGIEQGSVIADPLFYDAEKGDLRLKPDSPALKSGFVRFDVDFDSFGVDKNYPPKFRELDDTALREVTTPPATGHH